MIDFYFLAATFIIFRLAFQDNDYMPNTACVVLNFGCLSFVLYLPQNFLKKTKLNRKLLSTLLPVVSYRGHLDVYVARGVLQVAHAVGLLVHKACKRLVCAILSCQSALDVQITSWRLITP